MREPSAADLARLATVQRIQQRLVMLRDDSETRAFVDGGFGERDLHDADRAALLTATNKRHGVYRRLVRATLVDSVAAEIPRAAELLGERCTADAHAFISDELPRSPILRDVAFEFLAWAAPRWYADPSVPAWVVDLARLELLEFDAHCGTRSVDVPHVAELPADLPLVFDGTCRIGLFEHAVHELPNDTSDRMEPRAERHGVFLHRDANNRVRRLHLSPVAAAILTELLVHRRPLADAVRLGCAAEACAMSEPVIQGISTILEELGKRGALLGSTSGVLPTAPSRWVQLVAAHR